MKPKLPTGRLRRAFDLATVGARVGASWAAHRGADAAARTSAEVLGNLRGLAAKVGQTASYVDGILPLEHREVFENALSKLQRATPASPYEEIERTLIEELGAGPGALFATFQREPVASASIGQVHRATLKDGSNVAVKIQHLGIQEAMESDLRNVSMLEKVVDLAGPSNMKSGAMFEEVLLRFRQELDYRVEVQNQVAFAELHRDDSFIQIPEVYPEYCAHRVMTTRWVDGWDLDQAKEQSKELRRRYAETLWRFVFRGNLVGGAFNADPHPGNYVFHEDGRVTFLDFGCVQPISEGTRRAAVKAHRAVVANDQEAYAQAISSMLGTHGGAFGEATLEYTRLCFEPLEHQRFTLTPAYARELVHAAKKLKVAMKAKDGSFVPPPPHLALMNRLQFGFYSVIAKLEVEVDYRAVEATFLDEAHNLQRGYLVLDDLAEPT